MFRNKKGSSDASLASVVNQFEFECQPNQLHLIDTAYLPDEDLMATIRHLHEYVTHPDYSGKEYQMHIELYLPDSLGGYAEFENNLAANLLLIDQWNKRIVIYDKEISPYLSLDSQSIELPFLKEYPELCAWYVEFSQDYTPERVSAAVYILPLSNAPQGPRKFEAQQLPSIKYPKHLSMDYLNSFPNFAQHGFDFLAYEPKVFSWGKSMYVYDTQTGHEITAMTKLQKRFDKLLLRKVGISPQLSTILILDEERQVTIERRKLNFRSIQKLDDDYSSYESFIIVPDNHRWIITSSSASSMLFSETKHIQSNTSGME